MSSYTIQQGDDWSLISRKVYGTEGSAARLQKANPGAQEPLSPGTIIYVPPQISRRPPPSAPSETVNPDETFVRIEGKRFRFWEGLVINRSLDSIDSGSFTAPSDLNNTDFTEAFKPFSFSEIEVFTAGNPLFTGTMLRPSPGVDESSARVDMDCYGRPGVLQDCSAPSSDFPIEFNDLGLVEIASSLCDPFGIEVRLEADDAGATFDRVALNPQTKIFTFLANLARQRNLVLGDSSDGALVIRRAVEPGSPVAILAEGEPGVTSITGNFDPQNYYSHVTGLREALIGSDGESYTVVNSRLSGVLRPYVFQADDTEEGNLQVAVENKAGLMVGNAVTYQLEVSGWRDPSGNLWEPNTTIKLTAPRAGIPSPYEFLIRRVSYQMEGDSQTCSLGLVLPGSFSGKLPESLPWDS